MKLQGAGRAETTQGRLFQEASDDMAVCVHVRSQHSHTVPTLSAWRMRRVSACVYAMLWYDTSTAADAMLRVTTLCRYARVYCLHAWQLQVGSMGLVWGVQVWGTKRVDTEVKRAAYLQPQPFACSQPPPETLSPPSIVYTTCIQLSVRTNASQTCMQERLVTHLKSFAYSEFLSLSTPSGTSATPKRAVRVGYTLSYISAPRAVHTTMSRG